MKVVKAVVLAVSMFSTSLTQAATLTCAGKIKQVNYHSPDSFMLQLDSMDAPVFFCKPNATWTVTGTTYSTTAESCRTLIGIFLTAKAQDKALAVIYFDGDEVPTSCSAWGSWKSANVRYFAWAD